jgi:methyltransferase-like protein
MTPIAEALKKEHPDKKDYWQNELKSLGIEPRRQNELNDKEELQALAESIKESIIKITKRHMVIKARTTKK